MKVALDLEQLLADKHITQEEYAKLKILANQTTTSLAFSLLIGFGVIAVSGAALALVPTPTTAIIIGALVLVGGVVLQKTGLAQWQLLAQICVLVGALMLGGGILVADNGNPRSFIAIAFIYGISAVFAQSSLLTVLAVLSIGPILGAASGYSHAMYMVGVQEPLLTVLVFSVMGMGFFWVSQKLPLVPNLPLVYSHLCIIAARACLFMVNLGFWIGSLWGDKINAKSTNPIIISDVSFSVMWALALIGAGIWAWRENRRWVLNVIAVFGGIHFYTQWFEHLHASAATVLLAGISALVFAMMLRYINTLMDQNKTSIEQKR